MPPQHGMPSHGMPPQHGMPSHGMPPPHGMPSHGMPPHGMPPQHSMPSHGMPPHGMAYLAHMTGPPASFGVPTPPSPPLMPPLSSLDKTWDAHHRGPTAHSPPAMPSPVEIPTPPQGDFQWVPDGRRRWPPSSLGGEALDGHHSLYSPSHPQHLFGAPLTPLVLDNEHGSSAVCSHIPPSPTSPTTLPSPDGGRMHDSSGAGASCEQAVSHGHDLTAWEAARAVAVRQATEQTQRAVHSAILARKMDEMRSGFLEATDEIRGEVYATRADLRQTTDLLATKLDEAAAATGWFTPNVQAQALAPPASDGFLQCHAPEMWLRSGRHDQKDAVVKGIRGWPACWPASAPADAFGSGGGKPSIQPFTNGNVSHDALAAEEVRRQMAQWKTRLASGRSAGMAFDALPLPPQSTRWGK